MSQRREMTFDEVADEWERETYYIGRNLMIVWLFLAVIEGPREMLVHFFVHSFMVTLQPVLLLQ